MVPKGAAVARFGSKAKVWIILFIVVVFVLPTCIGFGGTLIGIGASILGAIAAFAGEAMPATVLIAPRWIANGPTRKLSSSPPSLDRP